MITLLEKQKNSLKGLYVYEYHLKNGMDGNWFNYLPQCQQIEEFGLGFKWTFLDGHFMEMNQVNAISKLENLRILELENAKDDYIYEGDDPHYIRDDPIGEMLPTIFR